MWRLLALGFLAPGSADCDAESLLQRSKETKAPCAAPYEGAGQQWAEMMYGRKDVKCCTCAVEMCTSNTDWQFCTACTCPNSNGNVEPVKPATLEGMCNDWFDVPIKEDGKHNLMNELNCVHPDIAMEAHLNATKESAAAGRYKGNVSEGACVWCDCCSSIASLCTAPNPEELQPYPWDYYTQGRDEGLSDDEARLQMWELVAAQSFGKMEQILNASNESVQQFISAARSRWMKHSHPGGTNPAA